MDMKNNRSPTKEDFLKIRENTGMNRKEFAEHLQIPYRTVQDWELGKRQNPVYVFVVKNLAVVQGKNGLFLNMPHHKSNEVDENGKAVYKDDGLPTEPYMN